MLDLLDSLAFLIDEEKISKFISMEPTTFEIAGQNLSMIRYHSGIIENHTKASYLILIANVELLESVVVMNVGRIVKVSNQWPKFLTRNKCTSALSFFVVLFLDLNYINCPPCLI